MCYECFDKQYFGFSSQAEFEKIDNILNLKCRTGKIKILESKNECKTGLLDFRMYYQCNICNENFILSIPDNAWRGYFLTEPNAIEFHKKLKTSNKNKKNGCIVILISIIIFIIYCIIKKL